MALIALLLCVAALGLPAPAQAAVGLEEDAANPGLAIASLQTIFVAADAHPADRQVAELLRNRLEKLYGVKATLKTGGPGGATSGILVGRAAVMAAGRISAAELEAVKTDGFVIRADAGWVSLAGYAPQGTIYAGYAVLRRLGLKIYPWRAGDGLEVFTPLADRVLAPFQMADKPFFELRDVLAQHDRGRFGGTLREYVLGDLRFAQEHPYFKEGGWLGWDHTAAYLAPPAKYAADHPEYYAERTLSELIKGTPNLRVALCMCEPDVHRIAAERALEWIAIQPERRYFAITDGDVTESRCPRCTETDPLPDYYTDRYLRWVNSVARAVRDRYPDKTLLALAYLGTVKPPVATALEPNVVVLYAPWYWTSRATSAVGLSSPLNATAWEELRGWTQRFPGQVGVYDYPGDWVHGTAARIKEYADLGVRWVYLNGPKGDLLHWVSSQLLWNPALDTEPLVAEFLAAYYGPAAGSMGRFLALQHQSVERAASAGSLAFIDENLVRQALPLLEAAGTEAATADMATRVRIFDGIADLLYWMLREGRKSELTVVTLREWFQRYIAFRGRAWDAHEALGTSSAMLTSFLKATIEEISALTESERIKTLLVDVQWTKRASIFQAAEAEFEPVLARIEREQAAFPVAPVRAVSMRFDGPGEETAWRTEAVPSDAASPARRVETQVRGETLAGVEIAAPFSRLPMVGRGNVTVHAGRFFAERTFEPPLEARGLPFIHLHLYASNPVPITVYLNRKDKLRSDVRLVAGEQIVRIDLRNYRGTRFDPDGWDGKIEDIALDLWPQDFFYPYPRVHDTAVILLGMHISNEWFVPALSVSSDRLVISYVRANEPYRENALKEIETLRFTKTNACKPNSSLLQEYEVRWVGERFRTFTPHLLIQPVLPLTEMGL